MNYKVIDQDQYCRKGVFRHFSEDCKYSVSMTARADVADLAANVFRLLEKEVADLCLRLP